MSEISMCTSSPFSDILSEIGLIQLRIPNFPFIIVHFEITIPDIGRTGGVPDASWARVHFVGYHDLTTKFARIPAVRPSYDRLK